MALRGTASAPLQRGAPGARPQDVSAMRPVRNAVKTGRPRICLGRAGKACAARLGPDPTRTPKRRSFSPNAHSPPRFSFPDTTTGGGPSLTGGYVVHTARIGLRPPPTPTPRPIHFPAPPVIGQAIPRNAVRFGRGGPPQYPPSPSERSAPSYAEECFAATLPGSSPLPWLHREPSGSALPEYLTTRQASLPLRTAQLLPPTGVWTLGSTRPVSSPSRQPATGLPRRYRGRTPSGRQRRVFDQVMT